jgi:N-acetylglucosaminyldiphosphoundecaprenol N-acetyl-beta-D-mannosaminyltransferase
MGVDVLGIEFDNVTTTQATAYALELTRKQGGHYAVTPNAEMLLNTLHDAHARKAIHCADLTLPDGISVVRAAKKLGRPLKERVTGIDFAQNLMAACVGKRFYLLGAAEGVAEKAGENLKEKYCIEIAGTQNGYYKDETAVLADIQAAKSDILFVCLGSPRQEKWMLDNRGSVGGCFMVGLGGCLDVWSGNIKRAPKLFIALKVEWLYRLIIQPWRIGRIFELRRFPRLIRRQRKQEKKA